MYKVIVNKQVFKSLDKIPKTYLLKIKSAVNDLVENPCPFGYVKLSGFDNLYRIRVGIYRIVYTIQDNILTVEVVKVDHRRSVCKENGNYSDALHKRQIINYISCQK